MKERRGQKGRGKERERESPQAFCLPFLALHKQLKQGRAPYSFICFSPLFHKLPRENKSFEIVDSRLSNRSLL